MKPFFSAEGGEDESRPMPKNPVDPSTKEPLDEDTSITESSQADELVPASTSRDKSEGWIPEVILWLPMYEAGYGNASKVVREDGRAFVYKHSSPQTWNDVLRFYAVDKVEYRNLYRVATGRSQSVPIVVPSRGLVLIPIKIRSPRVKNDGAIGYIADRFIKDFERVVENGEYIGLRIRLTTGTEVLAQMSLKNFLEQQRSAKYFMYFLAEHKVYPWFRTE